jgi:hypothetical protein
MNRYLGMGQTQLQPGSCPPCPTCEVSGGDKFKWAAIGAVVGVVGYFVLRGAEFYSRPSEYRQPQGRRLMREDKEMGRRLRRKWGE